jgi:hypothetical protein
MDPILSLQKACNDAHGEGEDYAEVLNTDLGYALSRINQLEKYCDEIRRQLDWLRLGPSSIDQGAALTSAGAIIAAHKEHLNSFPPPDWKPIKEPS